MTFSLAVVKYDGGQFTTAYRPVERSPVRQLPGQEWASDNRRKHENPLHQKGERSKRRPAGKTSPLVARVPVDFFYRLFERAPSGIRWVAFAADRPHRTGAASRSWWEQQNCRSVVQFQVVKTKPAGMIVSTGRSEEKVAGAVCRSATPNYQFRSPASSPVPLAFAETLLPSATCN